ncbi:pimeloyl-ACP methyl ester carboxylesterase [Kribbella voronezhensis]|uniref:Pimeloyl-ACP methyl ester carboxylesterase n=1 Tax=Kribbella voronezhensis TaxID=2512212 RepID=A0A4R7THV6_9ACTN|nr:pimeloyl-ACP methyl ester carboxylesterase [Kribbella voronezhensis]
MCGVGTFGAVISDVDGLPVYYESFGEGRPIVFLPGWGNANGEGRDVHEPVFADRPGWRRIHLDPPGTGKTPSREWITDQDGMLDVIARAIDGVIGSSAFAVAGTSAGGLHARGLVRRDPERILGLMLRVPGVVVDRSQRQLPHDLPAQSPEYEAALLEKQKAYYDPAEQQADLEFLGAIQGDVTRYSLSGDLSVRLEAPTLIVTGRQDVMTGYADAWSLLDDYPRATYAVLDEADHDLPVRNHALYRALVADWLDRIEGQLEDPAA